MRPVGILVAAAVVVAAAAIAIADTTATAVVCTSIADRAPVGTADRFPASVGRLMCFSDVRDGAGKVVHVWIRGDKEVFSIELRAQGPRWRTWSEKQILPEWTGPWRVEVRSVEGAVLATTNFTLE